MTEGEYEIFIADMLWDEIMGTDSQRSENDEIAETSNENANLE